MSFFNENASWIFNKGKEYQSVEKITPMA